jgi:hypothetical protein
MAVAASLAFGHETLTPLQVRGKGGRRRPRLRPTSRACAQENGVPQFLGTASAGFAVLARHLSAGTLRFGPPASCQGAHAPLMCLPIMHPPPKMLPLRSPP